MNDQKLRLATIGTLIGAFVLIVAMVLVWKFRFYDQKVADLKVANDALQTAQKDAGRLGSAQKAALLADQRLGYANGQLDYFRTRFRSLPLNVTDETPGNGPRVASFQRILNEYSADFGLRARAQILRAYDQSGASAIDSKITISDPPQNPEDVKAPPSGFLKPETAPLDVTLTGSFDNIVSFLQIINRSEILMSVGNLKLEGTSPTIKATFTLTPYLLVSGPSATQGTIAGLGGAAAAPAAAGGEEGGPGTPATPAAATAPSAAKP